MPIRHSFGSAKSGRSSWPPALHRTEDWPAADPSLMKRDVRTRYLRLQSAISHYVPGGSLQKALSIAKLKARRFLELVERCVEPHEDGRIQGFRALVHGCEVRPRRRKAGLKRSKSPHGGYSGAFGQLLDQHPSIRDGLVDWLLRKGKQGLRQNKTIRHNLHTHFLTLCREAGRGDNDYPLETHEQCRRALWGWHKGWFIKNYADQFVEAEHGERAAGLWAYAQGDGQAAKVYGPLEAWVMDAFTVDMRNKVRFQSKSLGWYDAETQRLTGLRLSDLTSGTNLGSKVVFSAQADANDVLEVICDAILGPDKLKQALEGVVLEPGAGYPAEVIEALRFAVPVIIYLDNALAHLCGTVQFALLGILGAEVRLGQPRTPRERGAIEAKYRSQALQFLHQMVGTTGSGPGDRLREIADVPVESLVDADVLAHALDAYVQNQNALPNAAAGYISGLEFLRRALRDGRCVLQLLPPAYRKRYYFCKPEPVTVHMDLREGRHPQINFKYASYRSAVLDKRPDLHKHEMWLRYDVRSLRTAVLFNKDGSEFGPVQATGKWARFPHTMWFRKLYGRLKNAQALGPRPETRPLNAVYDYLRDKAPYDRRCAMWLAGVQEMLVAAGVPVADQLDADITVELAEWEQVKQAARDAETSPVEMPAGTGAANDAPRRAAPRQPASAPRSQMPQSIQIPAGWGAPPASPPRAWKSVRR